MLPCLYEYLTGRFQMQARAPRSIWNQTSHFRLDRLLLLRILAFMSQLPDCSVVLISSEPAIFQSSILTYKVLLHRFIKLPQKVLVLFASPYPVGDVPVIQHQVRMRLPVGRNLPLDCLELLGEHLGCVRRWERS